MRTALEVATDYCEKWGTDTGSLDLVRIIREAQRESYCAGLERAAQVMRTSFVYRPSDDPEWVIDTTRPDLIAKEQLMFADKIAKLELPKEMVDS